MRTIGENPETVPVEEFRDRIDQLDRLVSVDWHACRGDAEVSQWARRAMRAGNKLINTVCKRATFNDWRKREMAIERSSQLLTRIREVYREGKS